ncbi:MAG: HNH endonuclease [Gammaproteobacteria bacterium]|nr:HNH endonuclease [Gammaproteobacteria bacterium]
MDIEWNHSRCIVCLNSGELTKEHVIPESLGGILTSRFLCCRCNSCFGAGFEANSRLAPEIRKAASGLGKDFSELKEKLELGAQYQSKFDEQTSKSKLRRDGHIGTSKLKDGSLIVPETDAPNSITSLMRKRGVADQEIKDAIAAWRAAPAGYTVNLGAGIKVRKWQGHPSIPTYDELPLSPLVPLKIAYEFTALLVGCAIYSPQLQPLRDVLLKQDKDLAGRMVTDNWASSPDVFHGIAFEGNHEVAQFQVRFFGLLAYTVRFPKIAVEHPPIVYTHRLNTGKEWAHLPDEVGQKPDGSTDHVGHLAS